MKEEEPKIKQSEIQQVLHKLMRLEHKESNFVYHDPLRKVQYPHCSIDILNQMPIKMFWKSVQTNYFKKIEKDEMCRVKYIQMLFTSDRNKSLSSDKCMSEEYDYMQRELIQMFDQRYLEKMNKSSKKSRDDHNWLRTMLAISNCYQAINSTALSVIKKTKLIFSKLKQNRTRRTQAKTKKLYKSLLLQQQKKLNEIIKLTTPPQNQNPHNSNHYNTIDNEIAQLQASLAQNNHECIYIVDKITNGVQQEQQQLIYMNMDQDVQSISFVIRKLQEKQIAQSICKIITSDRSCGQHTFLLTYQKAINIEPTLVNQRQLKQINNLRQTSLLKFYKTGVKSLYSYVCHNYAGFSELLTNRSNLSKVKDKDWLIAMKKESYLSNIAMIQTQMQQFKMCHHCKYIYPQYMLVTCKFTSQKQAMPKMVGDSFQSELNDLALQKSRISQRFLIKRKNCLTSYSKINGEYVCGRLFCKSCIKDNYAQYSTILQTNGACPFCEGICSCTRCLRNQKINKMKSLFINLGGDINRIQEQSLIQQLPAKADNCIYKLKCRQQKITNKLLTLNCQYQTNRHKKTHKIKKQTFKQNIYQRHNSTTFRRHELKGIQSSQSSFTITQEQTQKQSSISQRYLDNYRKRKVFHSI